MPIRIMTAEEGRALRERLARKKMGRRGPPKPTKMGRMDERRMTRGQMERLKEMRKRNSRPLPPAGAGMLTGGQIKIAKKAPPFNKINEKDFAVLRAEKAKGRGMGLQDEKMKPGKVMKADKGKIIKKDPTAPIKNVGVKDRYGMPMKLGKQLGSRAAEAAKATRIGKIAAGVAGAALLAKAGLEKMYEKRTGKKPFTKRPAKKMGGGMMMQRPMMAKAGKMTEKDKQKEKTIKKFIKRKGGTRGIIGDTISGMGGYMSGGLSEATQRLKAQGKMGGGMMMRPNPVGMKSGKSVKVKCKLGRNKPTKMY